MSFNVHYPLSINCHFIHFIITRLSISMYTLQSHEYCLVFFVVWDQTTDTQMIAINSYVKNFLITFELCTSRNLEIVLQKKKKKKRKITKSMSEYHIILQSFGKMKGFHIHYSWMNALIQERFHICDSCY